LQSAAIAPGLMVAGASRRVKSGKSLKQPKERIVIEQIKAAVHRAAEKHQKTAMFHFQVLKNADELAGIDPNGFCKEISVPKSFAAEFRKMIALAHLMKEQGTKLI
jgi:hypothetical protein